MTFTLKQDLRVHRLNYESSVLNQLPQVVDGDGIEYCRIAIELTLPKAPNWATISKPIMQNH